MRLATLLFLAALTPAAHAQGTEPDTTAPWRYFPMEVGNRWEYTYGDGPWAPIDREHWRWIITGDSLVAGYRRFLLLHERFDLDGTPLSSTVRILRFDTAQARVVEWAMGQERRFEYAPCDLDLPFVGWPAPGDCGESPFYVPAGLGYEQPLPIGVTTAVKRYDSLAGRGPWLAAGFGFVRFETLVDKGFYQDVRVRFMRVGGHEYGAPISGLPPTVPAEPGPGAHPLALAVAPNPAAGPLTLSLDVPVAGPVTVEAFDALGRRVHHEMRARSAGAHAFALDASAWPPGLYVVRVTAAGGAVSARVVRR